MTAQALLENLKNFGVSLFLENSNLKFSCPPGNFTPGLRKLVSDHKPEILAFLKSENPNSEISNFPEREKIPATNFSGSHCPHVARPRNASAILTPWPAAAADFVLLLTVDDLPSDLTACGVGVDPISRAKFLRYLQVDILRGPTGPRAFYGVLQDELRALRDFLLAGDESGANP